jgi:CRP-like cAMP-binding protein
MDASRLPGSGTPMSSGPMVAVLEVDPELAAGLDGAQLAPARREALAPLLTLEAGPWSWEPGEGDLATHLGLLVLDGVVTRMQAVGNLRFTELLGSGDILRPWISGGHATAAADVSSWRVIVPARVAVLDQDFAWRVRRWPQIPAALLDRAVVRSRALSVTLAIHRAVRVQDRVQMMLWHLAERWGHVTAAGTVLPIPLTHEALAQLVGARRSPVSTALGELRRRGLVERGPRGSWLLRGSPPAPAAGHAEGAPPMAEPPRARRLRAPPSLRPV